MLRFFKKVWKAYRYCQGYDARDAEKMMDKIDRIAPRTWTRNGVTATRQPMIAREVFDIETATYWPLFQCNYLGLKTEFKHATGTMTTDPRDRKTKVYTNDSLMKIEERKETEIARKNNSIRNAFDRIKL